MKRVKLSDFFRDDFLSLVNSHKKRIQDILNNYEIVIFMARKAICFFDALMENSELNPTNCHVISSRVIDYDGLDRFKGKKIAVVDDVVVKGTSINRVAEKLFSSGVSADYYVIACEKTFSDNFSQQFSLDKTYNYYTRADIYKLSGLITQYIEASMRTFNVDSPIYEINDSCGILNKLLCEKGSINLTSGLQKRYGITNQDLYFKFSENKFDHPIGMTLNKATIKIRFYRSDEKIIAVPFVLLPECSKSTLNLLYDIIRNDDFDALIRCENDNIQNENKYKTISYVLTMAFFCSFSQKYDFCYNEQEYYDIIQFDMSIGRILGSEQFTFLCSLFANIELCSVEFSQFEFSNYIKSAYEYIASINPDNQPYKNWKGELIGKIESAESDFLNRIVFSYEDLYRGINVIQAEQTLACVSCVIDIFIDKGFIVPSIVHNGDNNILRAYKMGEFSKLTQEQLLSFLKTIYLYQEDLQRSLDRTEFEKLCVLFFRMQINHHGFGEETEFDDGYYSIGYSYYGPRVSNSHDLYTVSKDSALVTDYVERDYVRVQHGKYFVANQPKIEDSRLNDECSIFALDYAALYRVFNNHPYKKTNNPWNQYIHTYDQYLTILAIGENRKNQILSLCAEIYQVVCLKEEMFFDAIDHLPVDKYKQILSGVNSGLWKYRCFKGDAFRITTKQIGDYGGINALRGIHYVQTTYDLGDQIVKLRDEMGEFLYRAAYILNELLRISERIRWFKFNSFDGAETSVSEDESDIKTIFSMSNFYYRKKIKAHLDAEIAKNVELYGPEHTIKAYFQRMVHEARYLLDKCDVYLEKNSPYLKTVNEFLVVYSSGEQLPTNFKHSTECVVSNLTDKSRIAVFSIDGENEREIIIDNLKCETQDISDCTYLLISSLVNSYEGYIQFDNSAKGTNVAKRVITVLKMIDKLPDKKQRLFVLRQNQDDAPFISFKDSKVERLQKAVFSSNNYCLDKYSIEREIVMEKQYAGGDIVNINMNTSNYTGSLAVGKCIKQEYSNSASIEDIDNLIQAVLTAAKDLSPEEQEEVKEYTAVIQSEATAETPKKGMIKTALEGLKRFVSSESFIDAVAKLAPVVMSLVHGKS